jgi:catechol 2,3-dioxygenase-like lactoylglutathione lyase family enzyme
MAASYPGTVRGVPSRPIMTVLLTDDVDEAHRFLTEVVGMTGARWFENDSAQATAVFGWPPITKPGRRVVLGEPPGMVELVEIPEELRGTIRPGVAFVAFATPDVEGYAERAAAAGFEVGPVQTVPGAGEPSTLAPITAGGLPWELMRFGS